MSEPAGYRPHLDGLRALAVYVVVLFHAGLAWFDGGFIGVDVFFVLSGYLVTQLLLRDLGLDGSGRVGFGQFYARRFRRLLPASAVVLVATALLYQAVAGPGEAADAVRSFQASFLYVANWYFIEQSTGYFAEGVAANPVLHFWSLAVEEQFYAVWPVLLAGLFALGRRTARPLATVRVAVAVGALASLSWALALQGDHPDRAYFGTDTRAYQLFAGALLALTPTLLPRVAGAARWLGAAGLVVLAALVGPWVELSAVNRGLLATLATVAVLAALDARPEGRVHAALSTGPITYLGRISYGTYLWHWPIIVVLVAVAEPSPIFLAAVTVAAASGLASLSAQLLELPIRTTPRLTTHRTAVIGAGLAISVVGALVVAPLALDRPQPDDRNATTVASGLTPVSEDLDLEAIAQERFGESVECVDGEPSDCTIVEGDGPHVLLMGDSNAQMLIPAFESFARQRDLTLSLAVRGGCPWQRTLYMRSTEIREDCERKKEDAYARVIPALDPDVIVVVNVAQNNAPGVDAPKVEETTAATQAALDQLAADGRTVILVEPPVQSPADFDPLDCLADARFLEDCRYVARTRETWVDELYAAEAERVDGVAVANIDELICPYLPICDPVVGGRVVRWDYQHLTASYSASLGDDLAEYFDANGWLDP